MQKKLQKILEVQKIALPLHPLRLKKQSSKSFFERIT